MNKYVLLLLSFLIIFKMVWISNMPLISDEYGHYFLAKYILQNGVPFFYQQPYLQPNWGIVQMPLFHYMLSAMMLFLPLLAIRLIIGIVIPLITTYFVWKLFYKYDQTGMIAVLSNFIPTYFIWSSTIYIDAFSIMLSLMTIYYYINNKYRWSLFFSLNMLAKVYIPATIFPLLLYDSWKTKKWKKLLIFVLLLAIFIPIQTWSNSFNIDRFQNSYMAENENLIMKFMTIIVGVYPNELFNFDVMYISNVILMTMIPLFMVFIPFILKKHKFEIIWFLTYAWLLIFGAMDTRRFLLLTPLIFWSIWVAVDNKKARNIIAIFILASCLLTIVNSYKSIGYLPEFYDAIDEINTLPTNNLMFTPYQYETSYYTKMPVEWANMDFSSNNATLIFIVKNWVRSNYIYTYTIPDIHTIMEEWIPIWNNSEYVIMRRPDNSGNSSLVLSKGRKR